MNTVCDASSSHFGLSPWESYLHAACLVLLDGLSYGHSSRLTSMHAEAPYPSATVPAADHNATMKQQCFEFLLAQIPPEERARIDERALLSQGVILPTTNDDANGDGMDQAEEGAAKEESSFGLRGCPFTIQKGSHPVPTKLDFTLAAPTTAKNVMRVLRGVPLLPASICASGYAIVSAQQQLFLQRAPPCARTLPPSLRLQVCNCANPSSLKAVPEWARPRFAWRLPGHRATRLSASTSRSKLT